MSIDSPMAVSLMRTSRRALALLPIVALLVLGALVLGAARAQAAPCPNAQYRTGPAASLPDCMAFEMVSPPAKGNMFARIAGISRSGGRVLFYSPAALGGTPAPSSPADRYVVSRSATGWTTAPTAPPVQYDWGPGALSNMYFSADLSRWISLVATQAQGPQGIGQLFSAGLGGLWSPLSPLLVPSLPGGANIWASRFFNTAAGYDDASPDLSHVFFNFGGGTTGIGTALLPGDPAPATANSGAQHNVYEAYLNASGSPSLALVTRDASGVVFGGNCGAEIGGARIGGGSITQGAVSTDASRVYFTTRPSQPGTGDCDTANPLRIMVRRLTPTGPEISELIHSECDRAAPACDPADGDDNYWGASNDGSKVFFTTTRQLANSDIDSGTSCSNAPGASTGCDLYLYDASRSVGDRLIQVSAGDASDPSPGSGADVLGVVAISTDGSHVYFVAQGVLTTAPNAAGQMAAAGQPNLYAYERDAAHPDGRTAFVASLESTCRLTGPGGATDDCTNLWGFKGSRDAESVPMLGRNLAENQVGGDGHILVFGSRGSVTTDDTDGGYLDVFRYDDETGSLERVSKATLGGSDGGTFDTGAWDSGGVSGPNQAQISRHVSENGRTIAFETDEGLARGDSDGRESAYVWRDGRIYRLPGISHGVLVSASGNEVAFTTDAKLSPSDGDTAPDVYVARVNGGFPAAAQPHLCQGVECQGPLTAAPNPAEVGSATFDGPGNVTPGKASHTAAVFRVHALTRRQQRRLARGRRIGLRVRISKAGRVRTVVRGRLGRHHRVRTLARSGHRARRGGTVRVRLRLSRRARRYLAHHRRLRVSIRVRYSHVAGAQRARVTLRSRRANGHAHDARRRTRSTHGGGER